jgi:hypothetical protein
MKIDIRPNLDQMRFYANSAKHAFDYQSPENARASVIADMAALLRYLDICDRGAGVVVAGISQIDDGIRLERSRRYRQSLDLTHGYAEQDAIDDGHADKSGTATRNGGA